MNEKLLRIKMLEHDDNQASLAKALNISLGSLNNKLNGKYQFKQNEIRTISHRYRLSAHEIQEIFLKGGEQVETYNGSRSI